MNYAIDVSRSKYSLLRNSLRKNVGNLEGTEEPEDSSNRVGFRRSSFTRVYALSTEFEIGIVKNFYISSRNFTHKRLLLFITFL